MLNKEKYTKEILEIACNGSALAVTNNKPASCKEIPCADCLFRLDKNCEKSFTAWANSEYVKPPVDWSKVPVDTPILVTANLDTDIWHKRYFAKYEHNEVHVWNGGATSWSARGNNCVTAWNFAKLAESED